MLYSVRFVEKISDEKVDDFLKNLGCKSKVINYEQDLRRVLLQISKEDRDLFTAKINRSALVQVAEQVWVPVEFP